MVFERAGQPLVAREFALPALDAGEVLVEIECATLCGSDLHTYEGRRATPCPTVLGHEILGRVAQLPSGRAVVDDRGAALRVGDRVTWSIAASCGGCFYCREALPQKCDRLFKYGHERIDERHPLSGGLATHCHLAAGTTIVRVPDALPDVVAAPANCATATVAAALRTAGDVAGRSVLIQGAGMLGLTACAMARAAGAREVLASDVQASRLNWAERFGATRTILVGEPAEPGRLLQAAREVSEGRGVDVALELSGAPAAMQAGLEALRMGGRHVWVGAVFPAVPVPVVAEMVVRRLLRIEGVHNYAPSDLRAAVDFLAATVSQFPWQELVTARFGLNRAAEAFRHAMSTRTWRVAVLPGR